MSWNMWSKCRMLCYKSHSNLFLYFRIHRKRLCSLFTNTRYFFLYMRKILHNSQFAAPVVTNPCAPSPCGPNSQCRAINNQAVCSCVPGYIGSPPTCRPECVTSPECALNKACVNQKCIDPCPGTCGLNAICQVVNHNPICSCPQGQTGDPFTRCSIISKISALKTR
jgi:hypothetical protein